MIPIFLSAFLMPLTWALGMAIALPLASWATTGMPPMTPPIVLFVIAEGLVTVAAVRALYAWKEKTLPLWTYIAAGILANRVVCVLLITTVLPVGMTGALATAAAGLAGLSLNLAVLPLLLNFFQDSGKGSPSA